MKIPRLILASACALLASQATALSPNHHTAVGQPCGLKIAPCPFDMNCAPTSPNCTDMDRCVGQCEFKNHYPSCGGFRQHPVTCDDGTECRDDPRLPKSCGMACDMPGICLPEKMAPCSGFAGRQCPEGTYCYDEPRDGCDPGNGGYDCIGVCI